MQNTTHYNLKKPDYTDFADIQDINDNMDTIDEKLAAPTGDARDQVVSFTDADLDTGITSFPTFLTKIVSGMKLAKFLRDFKAGMAYVLHVGDLINNATCTESGKALDARMGKTLQDQITSLNDSLTPVQVSVIAGAYATFDRYNCFRIGRIVWFSCAVTTSSVLTSANDLASGLPVSDSVADAVATTAAGNSYAIYAFGGRLKPNSSMPAGTYFINLMYIAST